MRALFVAAVSSVLFFGCGSASSDAPGTSQEDGAGGRDAGPKSETGTSPIAETGTPSPTSDSASPGDTGDGSAIGNPFAGADFYVNKDYVAKLDASMKATPEAAILGKVKPYATGIWLDRIAMVSKVSGYLDDALAQQTASGKPVVTVFVVYDLPNRDCHAKASNGELRIESGGVAKYKSEFIDPIAAAFKKHPNQRIVAIVEPDSLPNLATNLSDPACAAAESTYRDSVAYAIKTLAASNVSLYLDVGHSGWLGWTENQTKSAQVFKQVLDAAGGPSLIRGFASNVANYSVLHETKELFDYQGNPCHDELSYAAALQRAYAAAGITHTAWLIDTSRNGRGGIRHQWGYWCNNKGAGIGERPKADPAPGIDAYYWVKPPGESDGTSDPTAVRFDAFCGMEDAAKPAPEAGEWFPSYVIDAAKNANPPL
jgi:cellulose 1,4-beta-cellobiosidase